MIDILIPILFIAAIYGVVKYNKKRLNQKRHEIANTLEYPEAYPAKGNPRFDAIFADILDHFPQEWKVRLLKTNFYMVPLMKLNGQRIYGLAFSVYDRVFLDEGTINDDTDVNAYGLVIHEMAHMIFEHTRGGEEEEREAGEFTRVWLKTILGVDV